MKPDYKIIVDGQDITPTINGRLISLTLTDHRGMTSDEVTLSLDDSDGKLNMPRLGAIISVSIGFVGKLVHKGLFIADEISHSGPADQMSIKGRAANLGDTLKTQKSRSFHQKKLGDILSTIANDNNLVPAFDESLANIKIEHIDQTNESDANFISRVAAEHDALISIKENHLVMLPNGNSQTASGQPIPEISISRSQGDSHSYTENERNKYTGVKVQWQDPATGQNIDLLVGEDGTVKTLSKSYATKQEALTAALSEFKRLSRGKAEFKMTLAIGKPEMMTETPVKLSGYKQQIDEQSWVVKQITHTLNDSGLTSSVDMENGQGQF